MLFLSAVTLPEVVMSTAVPVSLPAKIPMFSFLPVTVTFAVSNFKFETVPLSTEKKPTFDEDEFIVRFLMLCPFPIRVPPNWIGVHSCPDKSMSSKRMNVSFEPFNLSRSDTVLIVIYDCSKLYPRDTYGESITLSPLPRALILIVTLFVSE